MNGYMCSATTPQSLLATPLHHGEAVELRLPHSAARLTDGPEIEVPPGAQLINGKLERAAMATIPTGTKIKVLEETADYTTYQFPAESDIRFPLDIRWRLALVIACSVAGICLWGTLVGSMLPLLFKELGFDPGYASSPFVATFVDVTGIIIYFSIAHIWLL